MKKEHHRDPTDIKKLIRKHYKKLNTHKYNNLNESISKMIQTTKAY